MCVPFTADYDAESGIHETMGLNRTLDGAILVLTIRMPFDSLAEGLIFQKVVGRQDGY
jgi:hypothetical protein